MEERTTPCPECRSGNPPENRFCGACGTSLTVGEQLARRPENGPPAPLRALLPDELKPVGRALAVGVATLAAQAGLAWLRRRAEGSGRTALPATRTPGSTTPEHPAYWSFEEVHAWLREGDFESRTFAQRTVRSFRATDPNGGQR
ncbi:hypothetical protein GBA65_03505 [Rubrobacter marinus]|uniref:Zinc-ribbon domain-containing protein n=1 Tax=Rubrobacter marinus TaxID=2653852 RepID=A0A6G8PUV9_9ACTN|nr:hypothetical protein [Rubrobacter marinus]QIN77735.1 hypothetical protein GBA65_03505 [Rubrobacter marinus]